MIRMSWHYDKNVMPTAIPVSYDRVGGKKWTSFPWRGWNGFRLVSPYREALFNIFAKLHSSLSTLKYYETGVAELRLSDIDCTSYPAPSTSAVAAPMWGLAEGH